jgi:soluble lytic murein transglycosylase-like protein
MNRVQDMVIKSSLILSLLMSVLFLSVNVGAASLESAPPQPTQTACRVSAKFPESIRQWCVLITQFADQREFSPDLIAAIILMESGGDPLAYSHSGAVGLMQVMPRDGIAADFQCINGPCFANRPTIEELQDPTFNVDYGTRMLAGLLTRLGNLRDALKSYGPGDAGYRYADKVLALYERYRE